MAIVGVASIPVSVALFWRPSIWPLLTVPAVLALTAWAHRSQTVEVDGQEIRAWFGGGKPRRWPLSEVKTVQVVRTHLSEGVGTHFTRRGTLYNVASGPAVLVRLRSGTQFMLGTDDAEALATAIRAGLPSAPTH